MTLLKEFNVAEAQLTYKTKIPVSQMCKISSSRDVVDTLRKHFDDVLEYREAFSVMLLNRANKVLGIIRISEGGISGTVADPKIILQAALLSNSSSIILSHNHPSGNVTPSEQDKVLTKKIKNAALFLDIVVLDHVIITADNYYSFADEGVL